MAKWLICSGPDWYRPSVTSTKHFAEQYNNDGYRILWINPVAFKSPFLNSTSKSSAWRKIKNKLHTHLRFLRRDKPGFWVWVPLYLPAFSKIADRINTVIFKIQFHLIRLLLNINIPESTLWISGSFTAKGILTLPFAVKVYQAADLISDFRGASTELKKTLQAKERLLCQEVDIRIAASENIASSLKSLCNLPVHFLQHGVDYRLFSSACELNSAILSIRSKGLPVAGYFGSLSDANDKDVFLKLASSGFSVVIIGKKLGDYKMLECHPDIYFIGPVSYSTLPSWANGFDVALLNWLPAEWIQNCFPIKALEYLAVGLPVVSCPIPVLKNYYSEVISFANTPGDFLDLCRQAVSENSESLRLKRRDCVKDSSWESKYQHVKELIRELRLQAD